MILKFWGRLYNISNDWKKIYLEDNYMYFEFAVTTNVKDVGGEIYSIPYNIAIDLDPNDEELDYNVKYILSGKAYDKVMDNLLGKVEYYDLDADYQQILKDSFDEYKKKLEEYEDKE